MSDDDVAHDYVFGFGSIINKDTHAPWLDDGSQSLKGQRANIRASFGYRRGWNFRSNTGFTALGITKDDTAGGTLINGVLFQIPHSMLPGFDRREVGYDRIEISLEHLDFLPGADSAGGVELSALGIERNAKIWVYVPNESHCAESNEDHPILQSYVDTVMQGCLHWGGEEMAAQFVATTYNWSPYFLNDTPSSRRPWLFRKEYSTIDSILSKDPTTHYAERRHPEEFASTFLIKMMRGTWSVPRRNTAFTGRDLELSQIHARLIAQRTDQYNHSGLAKLEIAGMGGVGKTQICTEYCYRYSPSYYGLVIWLSAQGAESIVACYRQLMADTTGTDVQGKDTDEVISEVKARLFRSKVPWLLVFDNLEDRSLLQKFVPHGGTCGHVLVTTRSVETDVYDQSTMILGCFSPSESIQLLCCIANISGEGNVAAASQLAEQLGHLPLALSMAAAYMLRCDVDCSEYLARYIHSGNRALLGHQVVASSLALSLNAIKTENQLAWEVLRLLCWLGPDQITKALVRSLLRAKHFYDATEAEAKFEAQALAQYEAQVSKANLDAMRAISRATLVGSLALLSSFMLERHAKGTNRLIGMRIVANSVVALSMAVAYALSQDKGQLNSSPSPTQRVMSSALGRSTSYSSVEFEQTDSIWKIVKSFSLLVVKDSKGSIHRLLSQALRTPQTEEASRRNLQICVYALEQAWNFKPEQIDTWQESAHMLEHLKAIVAHSLVYPGSLLLKTALLSTEAGVFSAMALNRFEEAKVSLMQTLDILDRIEHSETAHVEARVAALYELGRVFRYLGSFQKAEDALQKALAIRNHLASENPNERHGVATILYELGVLEVKKHSLDSAAKFLQQALDLRRVLEAESASEGIEAECAATLHQLAAVHVARKPPSLVTAEALLEEALGLRMQIGQRAATLKQLARVAIRRGEFDRAELSLRQALELYTELYGEAALHINVAAVKFQQGALAFQRQQLGQAWQSFSECLRARRHIYAYIQGNHLEVSSALHELGRVAFAQHLMVEAKEMLQSERKILEQLWETSSQDHRMLQTRLTNLVWLRKCSKELGDEEDVRKLTIQRNNLKQYEKHEKATIQLQCKDLPRIILLRQEALRCRSTVRQIALSSSSSADTDKTMLMTALESFAEQIHKCPPNSLRAAAATFHATISDSLELSRIERKASMLEACDLLRDALRENGLQVSDASRCRAVLHS